MQKGRNDPYTVIMVVSRTLSTSFGILFFVIHQAFALDSVDLLMLKKTHSLYTHSHIHTTDRQQFPVNGAVIKCLLMDSMVREDGQKEEEAETGSRTL